MDRKDISKMVLVSLFVAINVIFSQFFYFPLGPIKALPLQHFINVMCAVFVGPWYGLAQAFISSVLRIMFNGGTPFAFPGSMVGVFLAGMMYRRYKNITAAAVGEFVGTGIIGSLCTLPLMYMMNISFSRFMPIMYAFMASSLAGSIIAYVLILMLQKRKVLKRNS